MTSNENGAGTTPKIQRPFRPNLRQATLILPKTGQRVKRTVTFGNSPGFEAPSCNGVSRESSPLLGRNNSRQSPWGKTRLSLEIFKGIFKKAWHFAQSRNGRGVLKCSLAYFLGSLATFVPAIASMLGKQDGKHMVATITVYFHPARSQGSMFEAILLAMVAFLYAVFIGFTSMGVSILFGRTFDLIVLGHVIVLIVFCGGGLGFVGWIKQRLGNPLVNVACSLTSLAIITVLTKEGAVQAAKFSDDKIVQVLKMIVMGVIATTAVSFLVSPVSARTDLRENLISFTDSLSEVLTIITRSFLTGSEEELQTAYCREGMKRYKKLLATIERNLTEAKYEYYFSGTEAEFHIQARLVECMQRLAHNIGGLRSAASTQFVILAQPELGISSTTLSQRSSFLAESPIDSRMKPQAIPADHVGGLTAIDETSEDEQTQDETGAHGPTAADSKPSRLTPAAVFEEFILHLGPSMKSLAYTLRETLDDLPFGPAPDYQITVNPQFRSSLDEAIDLYTKARKEALLRIYDSNEVNKEWSVAVEADFEEVAASCGVFSYSLQDFGDEMKNYLQILDDLKLEVDERPKGRTWKWLTNWFKKPLLGLSHDHNDLADQEAAIVHESPPLLQPKSCSSDPRKQDFKQACRYRLWKALAIFRRDDTKFAIKVGAGAALWALPSFLSSTRPVYQHFRGEWGLLSYMLVCSMTIGASNTTGYSRFFGTCIGAVCAIIAWIASQGNVFALAALGWFMSFWTAYIIVVQGNGPMGRFIMLTYNLSALYAYSLSIKEGEDDDDEGGISPFITEIAFHRVVAVLAGCLWGLIVTRLIWPISARQKLKDGLSTLWLRMGLIWKRPPLDLLLEGESSTAYMDLAEELNLHRYLSGLEKLRSSAASEVGLRSAFPNDLFKKLLDSSSSMLDAFHAMNVIIMKEPSASDGEAAILRFTRDERAQLGTRISHLFQVMASSMKLEYPLNDALPSADHARDRLLAKIFSFRKGEKERTGTTDEDFALLYSYALVTGQLSKEIQEIGAKLEELFGVLNEDLLKLE